MKKKAADVHSFFHHRTTRLSRQGRSFSIQAILPYEVAIAAKNLARRLSCSESFVIRCAVTEWFASQNLVTLPSSFLEELLWLEAGKHRIQKVKNYLKHTHTPLRPEASPLPGGASRRGSTSRR
jgi:hypothetical protein